MGGRTNVSRMPKRPVIHEWEGHWDRIYQVACVLKKGKSQRTYRAMKTIYEDRTVQRSSYADLKSNDGLLRFASRCVEDQTLASRYCTLTRSADIPTTINTPPASYASYTATPPSFDAFQNIATPMIPQSMVNNPPTMGNYSVTPAVPQSMVNNTPTMGNYSVTPAVPQSMASNPFTMGNYSVTRETTTVYSEPATRMPATMGGYSITRESPTASSNPFPNESSLMPYSSAIDVPSMMDTDTREHEQMMIDSGLAAPDTPMKETDTVVKNVTNEGATTRSSKVVTVVWEEELSPDGFRRDILLPKSPRLLETRQMTDEEKGGSPTGFLMLWKKKLYDDTTDDFLGTAGIKRGLNDDSDDDDVDNGLVIPKQRRIEKRVHFSVSQGKVVSATPKDPAVIPVSTRKTQGILKRTASPSKPIADEQAGEETSQPANKSIKADTKESEETLVSASSEKVVSNSTTASQMQVVRWVDAVRAATEKPVIDDCEADGAQVDPLRPDQPLAIEVIETPVEVRDDDESVFSEYTDEVDTDDEQEDIDFAAAYAPMITLVPEEQLVQESQLLKRTVTHVGKIRPVFKQPLGRLTFAGGPYAPRIELQGLGEDDAEEVAEDSHSTHEQKLINSAAEEEKVDDLVEEQESSNSTEEEESFYLEEDDYSLSEGDEDDDWEEEDIGQPTDLTPTKNGFWLTLLTAILSLFLIPAIFGYVVISRVLRRGPVGELFSIATIKSTLGLATTSDEAEETNRGFGSAAILVPPTDAKKQESDDFEIPSVPGAWPIDV